MLPLGREVRGESSLLGESFWRALYLRTNQWAMAGKAQQSLSMVGLVSENLDPVRAVDQGTEPSLVGGGGRGRQA